MTSTSTGKEASMALSDDAIIAMARDAGAGFSCDTLLLNGKDAHDFICRFAALVAAKEREACAQVCEQTDEDGDGPDCWDWHAKDYARAIRARGKP
jgi:hypothetical protein